MDFIIFKDLFCLHSTFQNYFQLHCYTLLRIIMEYENVPSLPLNCRTLPFLIIATNGWQSRLNCWILRYNKLEADIVKQRNRCTNNMHWWTNIKREMASSFIARGIAWKMESKHACECAQSTCGHSMAMDIILSLKLIINLNKITYYNWCVRPSDISMRYTPSLFCCCCCNVAAAAAGGCLTVASWMMLAADIACACQLKCVKCTNDVVLHLAERQKSPNDLCLDARHRKSTKVF